MGSLLGPHKAGMKMLAKLGFYRGLKKNLLPGSFKSLAEFSGSFSTLRGSYLVLAGGPSVFKANNNMSNLTLARNLSAPLSAKTWKKLCL